MATHLVAYLQHVPVGGSPEPSTGRAAVLSVLLYAGVIAAAALLAVALGGRLRWPAAGGALVLVVADAQLGGGGRTALLAVHLGAVALWLGAVLRLVVLTARRPEALRAAARSSSPWAVGGAVVGVLTGVLLSTSEGVRWGDLTSTGFGGLVTAKTVLVLAAAVLGLGHRRTDLRRRASRLVRTEAVALAAALVLGAALLAVPLRRAVDQLAPGLAVVDFGRDGRATLFLAAGARRTSLVLLSDEPVAVLDRTTGRTLQVDPGHAVPVGLVAGDASLEVLSGRTSRSLRLAPVRLADEAGATPAEALQAALGAVLAGARPKGLPTSCDGQAWGRAAARLLHGAGPLRVVGGADPRARDFVDGARAAGLRTTASGDAVLLAVDKPEALRWLAAPQRARAVYLAPWLLDRDVLSLTAHVRLPPLLVVAPSEAMSPAADRYRQDLALLGAGLAPSAVGLQSYLAAAGEDASARAALFAATPVGFLPGVLEEGHGHAATASWVPGGSLVQVSRPRPVSCPTS